MNAPAITASQASFIRAAEIWVPDAAGDRLVLFGSLHPATSALADAGAAASFARGEGLPGRAWAEGAPVLMLDLSDPAFLRGPAARLDGLGAAIAVPFHRGAALQAVLVLFFAMGEAANGAVEIWRAEGDRMGLQAGFYGAARDFQTASQAVTFARGQGLPGAAWAAGVPYLLQDLSRNRGFLRAEAAGAAGLTKGLGLPVGPSHVLTLLSSPARPIARRTEIWEVRSRGAQAESARLADGFCDVEGAIFDSERELLPWQGAVGRAMAAGLPVAEAAPLPGAVPYAGVIALPSLRNGEVTRVTALFL